MHFFSDECWKIRHLAYQLLHQVYVSYKEDSLKELACNALWDVLERFVEKEKNSHVLNINKLLGNVGLCFLLYCIEIQKLKKELFQQNLW